MDLTRLQLRVLLFDRAGICGADLLSVRGPRNDIGHNSSEVARLTNAVRSASEQPYCITDGIIPKV
jgi:hypothetical protein